MATLPKNPTVQQYNDYFETLNPDQKKQFKKAGLLNIINQTYTDKADDVREDDTPTSGSISSGVFIDRKIGSKAREFRFKITASGGNYNLEYQPVDRAALMREQAEKN
jgi:hypothetical protein